MGRLDMGMIFAPIFIALLYITRGFVWTDLIFYGIVGVLYLIYKKLEE